MGHADRAADRADADATEDGCRLAAAAGEEAIAGGSHHGGSCHCRDWRRRGAVHRDDSPPEPESEPNLVCIPALRQHLQHHHRRHRPTPPPPPPQPTTIKLSNTGVPDGAWCSTASRSAPRPAARARTRWYRRQARAGQEGLGEGHRGNHAGKGSVDRSTAGEDSAKGASKRNPTTSKIRSASDTPACYRPGAIELHG